MVISYRIPNGHMRIEADMFFCQATKPKIKRMLKQLHDTNPPHETIDEIRDWLQVQITAEKDQQKEAATKYARSKSMLAQSEELYERMKSPCYAVYTTDKDKLKTVREQVMSCRVECRARMSDFHQAQKLQQKYESLTGDLDEIFFNQIAFRGGETNVNTSNFEKK